MTATQQQIDRIHVRVMPDPEQGSVTPDGPLRSIQEAELAMPQDTLDALWNQATLERLARAYWRYLNRVSFGLLKIGYGANGRYVVLAWRRLVLLRFRLPEYDVGPGFGRVTWPIEKGVLVAGSGRGRGYLRIDARRLEPDPEGDEQRVRIRAIVSNFYPTIRGQGWFARLGSFLYAQTQLRIHVLVTRGFLRSLESGDLPPLRPGREAAYQERGGADGPGPHR